MFYDNPQINLRQRTEYELAPLDFDYRYPQHFVREGLTFDNEQRALFNRMYSEHAASLPFLEHMEAIDAATHDGDPDLYLGRSTAERTFAFTLIDPISSGHGRSVGEALVNIARRLDLGDIPDGWLYYGGWYHDVLKVGQADLLLQPDIVTLQSAGGFIETEEGKFFVPDPNCSLPMLDTNIVFNQEQKAKMHTHPKDGADYLRRIGYPEPVAIPAEQHHAYFTFPIDGKPYPDIPPELRSIIGEATGTADFITSSLAERVYKPRNSIQDTIRYLLEMQRRGRLSPQVAQASISVLLEDTSFMRHTIHLPNLGGGVGLGNYLDANGIY